MNIRDNLEKATQLLEEADAVFITAGAGMGVDSGLPDFRSEEGFWNVYPQSKALELRFEELANPKWFESDPQLAWAFYGHRLHLYRNTIPHNGFKKLLGLSKTKKYGVHIFTSNVDGQFQKAGFKESEVMECHGTIHQLQCSRNCQHKLWSADDTVIEIEEDFRAEQPLPACPYCGAIARPNILMFGDFLWEYSRTDAQRSTLVTWMDTLEKEAAQLAILEIGAGTAVRTVRNTSEQIAKRFNLSLIRINTQESYGAEIALPMGALEALNKIL